MTRHRRETPLSGTSRQRGDGLDHFNKGPGGTGAGFLPLSLAEVKARLARAMVRRARRRP
jgi:hypothetical protein